MDACLDAIELYRYESFKLRATSYPACSFRQIGLIKNGKIRLENVISLPERAQACSSKLVSLQLFSRSILEDVVPQALVNPLEISQAPLVISDFSLPLQSNFL
jgi:hypothetical protein